MTNQIDTSYSTVYQLVGQKISELRKLHEDSQQELAEKIQISRSSISNIEAGRQAISLHLIFEIANVYGADFTTLIPSMSEVFQSSQLSNDLVVDFLNKSEVSVHTKQQILELVYS
jgi:transcriptional regulator with XRE-family HTH domain